MFVLVPGFVTVRALRFDADQVTIDTLSTSDQLEELTLFEPSEFGMPD